MAIVINGGTTEETLSWADSFIKDLLTEEEKYQDVIKDLSTDAIAHTVRRLDYGTEEYVTGTEILQNRATSSTSYALVVVDEEVDRDASETSRHTRKANKEADDETNEQTFKAERETSAAVTEAVHEATVQEEYRAYLEQDIGDLWNYWVGQATEGVMDLLSPLAAFMTEALVTIIPAAIEALFGNFMDAFFEEV